MAGRRKGQPEQPALERTRDLRRDWSRDLEALEEGCRHGDLPLRAITGTSGSVGKTAGDELTHIARRRGFTTLGLPVPGSLGPLEELAFEVSKAHALLRDPTAPMFNRPSPHFEIQALLDDPGSVPAALGRLVERVELTGGGGVVLRIDDVQKFSEQDQREVSRLLSYMREEHPRASFAAFVTAEPTLAHAWPGAATDPRVHEHRLPSTLSLRDEEAVARWVAAQNGKQVSDDALDEIHRTAHGHMAHTMILVKEAADITFGKAIDDVDVEDVRGDARRAVMAKHFSRQWGTTSAAEKAVAKELSLRGPSSPADLATEGRGGTAVLGLIAKGLAEEDQRTGKVSISLPVAAQELREWARTQDGRPGRVVKPARTSAPAARDPEASPRGAGTTVNDHAVTTRRAIGEAAGAETRSPVSPREVVTVTVARASASPVNVPPAAGGPSQAGSLSTPPLRRASASASPGEERVYAGRHRRPAENEARRPQAPASRTQTRGM